MYRITSFKNNYKLFVFRNPTSTTTSTQALNGDDSNNSFVPGPRPLPPCPTDITMMSTAAGNLQMASSIASSTIIQRPTPQRMTNLQRQASSNGLASNFNIGPTPSSSLTMQPYQQENPQPTGGYSAGNSGALGLWARFTNWLSQEDDEEPNGETAAAILPSQASSSTEALNGDDSNNSFVPGPRPLPPWPISQ